MGSNAAEIKYGTVIPWEQVKVLMEKFNTKSPYNLGLEDDLVDLYNPYETEDFMLIAKKAPGYNKYDGTRLLKDNFAEVDKSWKTDIIQFCEKYSLKCNPTEIGWHLIGHYA